MTQEQHERDCAKLEGTESDWDRTWRLAQPFVFRNPNQDQPKDWNKPKERK